MNASDVDTLDQHLTDALAGIEDKQLEIHAQTALRDDTICRPPIAECKKHQESAVMKNLFAAIGCVVVLKKAWELYREHQDLRHYKQTHAPQSH
ncbi:hypothetical protein [Pseudomonas sp. PH1b]|uniref:hypothetical protein n=1 Tax=Pseudomonas sp. PH1b TaxID=1397282 RepID=UPI00046A426D|nr:hypothetical protein [Pseudomonas sp. PH1b]